MANPAKFKDELVECFDEDGVTRMHPRYRSEVCTDGSRRWHGVANVWVVNREGMILCTQRSITKAIDPNKWQTFCGGHMRFGDSFADTAIKELYEEIGIKAEPESLKLIVKGQKEKTMHVFERYAFLFEGGLKDLKFVDGETQNAKWYSYEAYLRSKEENPENWCNELTEENYLKITEWLKNQK